uniref:putative claudin-24 n=1 Tax=Ictidomys tridecemlineatus TaxID=43179 RepID=UPI00038BBF72|nr:putative claudin-24 [Ictidomys tridecemlineatus]
MGSGALCLAQNVGLLVSVAGYVCSLVTLCIPQWLTFSSGLLQNERYMLGLWETCMTQDFRGSVCQGHTARQNLAAEMRVARILLCVASTAGSLGLVAIFLELTCLRYLGCREHSLEKNSNVVGGALFFLAGLTTLAPVSYIAHVTVQKFWGSELPTNLPSYIYMDGIGLEGDIHIKSCQGSK